MFKWLNSWEIFALLLLTPKLSRITALSTLILTHPHCSFAFNVARFSLLEKWSTDKSEKNIYFSSEMNSDGRRDLMPIENAFVTQVSCKLYA